MFTLCLYVDYVVLCTRYICVVFMANLDSYIQGLPYVYTYVDYVVLCTFVLYLWLTLIDTLKVYLMFNVHFVYVCILCIWLTLKLLLIQSR